MARMLLLFSLLVLVSCKPDQCSPDASQGEINSSTCSEQPAPEPLPDPEGEVPNEALIFDAKVQFTNFDRDDEEKVYKAIEIIKKVVATREFRAQVINFTYNGKRQFVDNRGFSNEEIYTILLEGKEELVPEIDNEMNLDLELYYSWRNIVGYTYPDTLRIWMNTKFFDHYTPAQVAGNIFHEWLHKLGFDHSSSHSSSRDASVPYALGYLIRDLGKKYE